ncbi:MAG: cation-translocating P-type ATPase [Arachidicoccus sp.]|nr:cation-translocating P-type ATPase [Arachidicoccus sp.]
MQENIQWKVEGMSCTNCALSIEKLLKKIGAKNVAVDFLGGEVSFVKPPTQELQTIQNEIDDLGYHVVNGLTSDKANTAKNKLLSDHFERFIFCLIFTVPLWLHMFLPNVHWLMNPLFQIALTLPVFIEGMIFFGKSGFRSLRKGTPNMNVLVAVGAIASFAYSLYGTLSGNPMNYMFYETTATIITLVFLGNWLEDRSVQKTQEALNSLAVSQKSEANMIVYDEQHNEHIMPVASEHLKTGDLVLIKSGEFVPADCKILSGAASVDESILTGESSPAERKKNDALIGGSMLSEGTVKAYVTATGKDTVLNRILQLVKDAQADKPPMQQLADKISAIFVPAVLIISLICFLINYFIGSQTFEESLLRSVAVLVISCPCAMGLATPAAIAVGLGRAAKHGILFRNARSLEVFKNIKQIVFDKTGTLTTGEFAIKNYFVSGNMEEDDFKKIIVSMEKFSNHPIAKAIIKNWKTLGTIVWKNIKEVKGIGVTAEDKDGNIFWFASYKKATGITEDLSHNLYLIKNNELLGWVDVQDAIRPEAKKIIGQLHAKGLKTVLLSGDSKTKCDTVAKELGIDEVYAEQTPEQKLNIIDSLNKQNATAMVGDGINDAPALAKATIGVSLSDSSQIAIQTAQVVLMNHGLVHLPLALGLGKATFTTIKQNLFWAFAYNIVAIPIACFGLLSPSFAALAMGFSDIALGINSVRLSWKAVD